MKNEELAAVQVCQELEERKSRPFVPPIEARGKQGKQDAGATGKRQQDAGATKLDPANKKLDAVAVWKQIEDQVALQLKLPLPDRAGYYHLLQHTRLEGKTRLHFSMNRLGTAMGLSSMTVRNAVRRLVAKGVLRLVERTKAGHVVDVRLPEEIRAVRVNGNGAGEKGILADGGLTFEASLEDTDFFETSPRREAIFKREGGSCFYCMRQVPVRKRCMDHVVPRAHGGNNSYRNLVLSCMECNALKGEDSAEDFLRKLFRRRQLGAAELEERLSKVDDLAAGKLRPMIHSQEKEK